ncbi:ImmA/IrrE family metallo-endopeptidase [Lysinibacillus xylanilyticus]|uniref:ImmA/IrrE family metallo-endopeptidase n=1 Tax=Lysinibacillus xylanilyticus TaxID=582475 RepID=UPI003D034726
MDLIKEAVSKAEKVFLKYNVNIPDWNNYRCDSLLMNIVYQESIFTEGFRLNDDLCGMLIVDEYEKTIVYNDTHSPERRNFTIGHELGHYFLHLEKKSQFEDRSKNMLDNTINEFEMQANTFASHLILPDIVIITMLGNGLHYFQIKNRVKISDTALYWRLVNYLMGNCALNRISAKKIVDEFRDLSIASIENITHHKNAFIYSKILNKTNIERLAKLFDNAIFIRSLLEETFTIKDS